MKNDIKWHLDFNEIFFFKIINFFIIRKVKGGIIQDDNRLFYEPGSVSGRPSHNYDEGGSFSGFLSPTTSRVTRPAGV